MPIYFVTVRALNGQRNSLRVKAQSAEQVKSGLKKRGFIVESVKDEFEEDFEEETPIKQHNGEVQIASLEGARSTIVLTARRVRQEISTISGKVIKIIPLHHVDSLGIVGHQHLYLAILGGAMFFYGLYASEDAMGLTSLFGGVFFIALWWGTKKVGAVIFSVSGKTEIFFEAKAGVSNEIMNFLEQVQTAMQRNASIVDEKISAEFLSSGKDFSAIKSNEDVAP